MPVTVFQDIRARRFPEISRDRATTPSAVGLDFKAELAAVIPALRAFARSLCGNPALADDLVQETLLKAWTARSTFLEDRSLKSWTFTILHNVFHSEWRTSRRFTAIEGEGPVVETGALGNPDAALELADVARVIGQLPAYQQEALILIAAGGFTYGEAASITGVPVGTVKSRVCRARTALATVFNGD